MIESELIARLAEASRITRERSRAVIASFKAIVREEVAAGREVRLTGLGAFTARQFPERRGRHPRTGEMVIMPARRIPRFKTSPVWRKQARPTE